MCRWEKITVAPEPVTRRENLATLRRLALNLLRREKTKKRGIKGKQRNAGWDHAYLLQLLGQKI